MSESTGAPSPAPQESPTVRSWRARRDRSERVVSDAVTRFSGSMAFVGLHVVWFAVWIVLNLALPSPFDPFPFGLLTLVVSLEAIFLSTFVLISQNAQGQQTDDREVSDFKTDIYAEVLSELIADRLGITADEIAGRYRDELRRAGFASDR